MCVCVYFIIMGQFKEHQTEFITTIQLQVEGSKLFIT